MCVFQNKRKFSAGSGERPADLRASTGRSANMAESYTYESVDLEFIVLVMFLQIPGIECKMNYSVPVL